ncbi:type II toxin-antitoxin system death-on-curing family toxin [Candidatus Uhrbacteria bacterium]|nr:type II toxin-antitoxin system death-on-curing family toxin [Candidatus Uhrbacteria bacterium]
MEQMCHRLAMAIFDTTDDPIAPFKNHTTALLESALNLPKATFDGKDLYPSLFDKATILYYTLTKNHPFQNGNKRIATATLFVFLYINNHWIDAGKKEIADKTLFIAESKPSDRDKVLDMVRNWLKEHLVSMDESL